MTLGRQVARLRAALQAGGVGGHEARLIAQHVLGLDATAFALALSEPVADAAAARMEAIAQARLTHRPLQLLLGQCAFYGLPMAVAEGVLIPRPDTEILVEACLERMGPAGRALDLCCGSGCVGVALAHERPHWRVDGADLDGAALALSARNAQRNGVAGRMRFFQGDLFAALPEGRYDLIACNPPYIPTGDIPGLMPEVRDYDPRLALDGGADGLACYRAVIAGAPGRLEAGGWIALEVGRGQAGAVAALLEAAGFGPPQIARDLAGVDRVVAAKYH
ncbi:MAG: peptide chain release factor N(5)-glutamine methyltransferase [Christensenellales bacterium]|jgi:release factor glutamine methyltransferase